MRHLILFTSLTLAAVSAWAQPVQVNRDNYALLWEITGNGLTQPSYLFGSMHIRQKDIFEFPDSLFIFLESCDAFANEIHLDSAMNRYFATSLSETKYYSEGKVTPLPPPTLSSETGSANQVAGLARPQRKTQQGMPTMLDAYLMNVARSQGKILFGLENIDEHLGITTGSQEGGQGASPRDFGFGSGDAIMDELIEIYQSGDLERISAYVDSHGGGEDLELIPRNYIMRDAIQQITRKHSLFAVVGAAHLPGKEGVVELLGKAGYQLRRITPTFRGLARTYAYTPQPRTWYQTQANNGHYQFETPIPAQAVGRRDLSEYFVTFDLGEGMGYLVSTEYLLPGRYRDFEKEYFEDNEFSVLSADTISVGGQTVLEYRLAKNAELRYYRARVHRSGGRLYYQQLSAFLEHNLYNEDAERFFNSFVIRPKSSALTTATASAGAFSIALPANHTTTSYTDYQHHRHHVWRAIDGTGHYYSLHYVDAVNLNFQDTAVLSEILQQTMATFSTELPPTDSFSLAGLPGLAGQANLKAGVKLNFCALRRGARVYMLLTTHPDSVAVQRFYQSFTLLPIQVGALTPLPLSDWQATLAWPDAPKPVATHPLFNFQEFAWQIAGTEEWEAVDSVSGGAFYAGLVKHGPYFRVADPPKYYRQVVRQIIGSPYVVSQSRVINHPDRLPEYEVLVGSPHSSLYTLVRLRLQGNILVVLAVSGPRDWLGSSSPELAQFFMSLHVDPNNTAWSAQTTEGNTTAFLQALFGTHPDHDVVSGRLLRRYPFTPTDLPVVAPYLATSHWRNANEDPYRATRLQALQKLGELHDDSPLPLLKDLWEAVPDAEVRTAVLTALAGLQTESGLATLFALLPTDTAVVENYPATVWDSYLEEPTAFLKLETQFLQAFERAQMTATFWRLATAALADSSLDHRIITNKLSDYQEKAILSLSGVQNSRYAHHQAVAVFDFLAAARLADPQVVKVAQSFFKRGQPTLASVRAADYLLSQGQLLASSRLDKIFADSTCFLPLLKTLDAHNRMDLAPDAVYQPEKIAREIFLASFPQDLRSQITELTWVGTGVATHPVEGRFTYHTFRFTLAGSSYTNIGVAGFFSADGKSRRFKTDGWANHTLQDVRPWQEGVTAQQLAVEMPVTTH